MLKVINCILIKEFTQDTVETSQGHIFSGDHLKKGIMKLGDSEEDILEKFIEIIIEADKAGLIKHGDNTIHTIISGHFTIVKARVTPDGAIQSINGYLKTLKNPTNKGNSFVFCLEKYNE